MFKHCYFSFFGCQNWGSSCLQLKPMMISITVTNIIMMVINKNQKTSAYHLDMWRLDTCNRSSILTSSVTRIYSNIRIIATEYYIFEYEYSIFLFRIYSIFVFGQVAKNEYIRYSYSVRLGGTNIFDIRIRSGCKERIYSIFVFSEIFLQIYFYLYSLTTRQYKLLRSA